MDKTSTPIDETYLRAMKFVENFKKFHPGISNLYVFTATDENGNIVDECYGMNLMTNNGFRQAYPEAKQWTPGTSENNLKLYVGSGSSVEYSVTDTRLENACFGGLAATNSNTTKEYNYPMYYAVSDVDGDGIITLISRFLIAYYDNNISGISDPIYISEYGIGTSSTALWTHSHVYDMTGERTSMTKVPGQRLTITVYMCLSFQEKVIQNGWTPTGDNGKNMAVITTNQIMFNRMFESRMNTYKRNAKIYQRQTCSPYSGKTIDAYHTMNTASDNAYINSSVMKDFNLVDGGATDNGYIDGFSYYTDGCLIVSPQELDTPENITLENYKSPTPWVYSGFADRFGAIPDNSSNYTTIDYPPFTRLIDPSVYLFNWKTNAFDNQLSVYNPNGKRYTETIAAKEYAVPIYYANAGRIETGYVYQNPNINDAIVAINGSITVYATNKYWVNSQSEPWIWIQDLSNVPQAARHCRYWITGTNSSSLEFVRASDCFQLLEPGGTTPADNGYADYVGFPMVYGCHQHCDSPTYNWYMLDNKVYYPPTQQTYTIGDSDITGTASLVYNQWLLTFNSVNNKFFLTDTGQISSGIVAPTEVPTDFTGTVNSLTQCYRTESGTGIILMQSLVNGVEECQVIDLRSGYSHHVENWKMACCVWGTNKIAYIPAGSSDNNIYIYNMTTQALDGSPIPFPTGVTTVPVIYGHMDHIWFTTGTSTSYVVDISQVSRTPSAFTDAMGFGTTDRNNIRMTAVDDVFCIYKTNEYSNMNKVWYVDRTDNNMNYIPGNLADLNVSHDRKTGRINVDLRYINKGTNRGTLMLTVSWGYYTNASADYAGALNMIVDFGQYLKTGTLKRYYAYGPNTCNYFPFGESIIYRVSKKTYAPNWLPIKLVGKTDTITAINGIRHISGKTWTINYTNLPLWGDSTGNRKGIPPGKPLATTDGTGAITGWS